MLPPREDEDRAELFKFAANACLFALQTGVLPTPELAVDMVRVGRAILGEIEAPTEPSSAEEDALEDSGDDT